MGSPAPTIQIDQFSARWTGQVQAQFSQFYTFYVLTDDGVRLWVNNVPLIDKWFDQWNQEWNGTIFLTAGQRYDIRMEFYENTGGAEAHLFWSSPSTPKQIIPTRYLYPPASPTPPLYQGLFEGASCATIYGWAADRSRLNTSINVDIYDGATLLATVPANLYRPDIPLGDNGLHGFSYAVPASLRDGQNHAIWVRYGGTGIALPGSPQLIMCGGTAVPAPPSGLMATPASASQINLAWTDNSNDENGFQIERKEGAGGSYAEIATVSAGVTTYADPGRVAGITYTYRVRAYNNAGASAYSNEASATIAGGGGPPAAPSGLTATAVSGRINLSWTDNSTNEADFIIERLIGNKPPYRWLTTVGPNVTSYTNLNLARNTTYSYRVKARNGAGESAYSNEASAATTSASDPCGTVSAFSGVGGVAGSYGFAEGAGPLARWRSPSAGAVGRDPVSGLNALFIADTENHAIRMIYLEGPAEGHAIRLAGSGIAGYGDGGGDPLQARFNYPQGIAAITGPRGVVEALLIADTDNHVIRLLLPPAGNTRWRPAEFSGKKEAAYVDGGPTASGYSAPQGVAVGGDGFVYVADTGNGAVRRLDREGNSATMYKAPPLGNQIIPIGIIASSASEGVYVSDQLNHSIYHVTEGVIAHLAGSGGPGYQDGEGAAASFNAPYHLAWGRTDQDGVLFICDLNNRRIRVLDIKEGVVSSYAGSGAAGYVNAVCTLAAFNQPSGIAQSPGGRVYVIEKGNNSIRKLE